MPIAELVFQIQKTIDIVREILPFRNSIKNDTTYLRRYHYWTVSPIDLAPNSNRG